MSDTLLHTERLRRILFRAEEQARHAGHSWIGTEHLIHAMAIEERMPAYEDDLSNLRFVEFFDAADASKPIKILEPEGRVED